MAEITVELNETVEVDIDVEELYDSLSKNEKRKIVDFLTEEKLIKYIDIDNIEDLTYDEKFLKELAYNLKYTNSTYLNLMKENLEY